MAFERMSADGASDYCFYGNLLLDARDHENISGSTEIGGVTEVISFLDTHSLLYGAFHENITVVDIQASDLNSEPSGLEVKDYFQNLLDNITATVLSDDTMDKEPCEVTSDDQTGDSSDLSTAVIQGSELSHPLNMPERPSTISTMKDNINFDISEFFDLDTATASKIHNGPQSSEDPILSDKELSTLPSGISKNIHHPAVDFVEYLRQSQSMTLSTDFKLNALTGKRGQQTLSITTSGKDTGDESRNNVAYRDNCFNNAFMAGAKDNFLPAMPDSLYDEEFAAFAATGIKSGSQSSKGKQSSRLCDDTPVMKEDSNYTKAGEIYVSYLIRQKIELSGKSAKVLQRYTLEETQWAKNYLSDEVKAWLKNGCGTDAMEGDWSPAINADDERESQKAQDTAVGGTLLSEADSQNPALLSSSAMLSMASSTINFTCVSCSQVFSTKSYLIHHIAANDCQSQLIKPRKIPDRTEVTASEFAMTNQELLDCGLPNIQAKSLGGLPYCEACGSEFPLIHRLESHILRSCPVLKEIGMYKGSLIENTRDNVQQSPLTDFSTQNQIKSSTGSDRNMTVGDLLGFNESLNTSASVLDASKILEDNNCATDLAHNLGGLQVPSRKQGYIYSLKIPETPKARNRGNEKQNFHYPERVRLFSEEIARSSSRTPTQLEGFEDLPQKSSRGSIQQSFKPQSGLSRMPSQPAMSTKPPDFSTVQFSFTDESSYGIAIRKLEVLLMNSSNSTLQSLRMWPSVSVVPSQSRDAFTFKVTAPTNIKLTSILRQVFPDMVVNQLDEDIIFSEKVNIASGASSLSAPAQNSSNGAGSVAAKYKHAEQVETPLIKQPRRSSKLSTGLPPPKSASQINFKVKVDDGSKDLNEAQRRRSSSRISDLRGEPEGPSDKKQKKTK